jgi:hypothetical protein
MMPVAVCSEGDVRSEDGLHSETRLADELSLREMADLPSWAARETGVVDELVQTSFAGPGSVCRRDDGRDEKVLQDRHGGT